MQIVAWNLNGALFASSTGLVTLKRHVVSTLRHVLSPDTPSAMPRTYESVRHVVEEGENGENSPVTWFVGEKAELREDAVDVGFDRLRGEEEPFGDFLDSIARNQPKKPAAIKESLLERSRTPRSFIA